MRRPRGCSVALPPAASRRCARPERGATHTCKTAAARVIITLND